MSEEWRVTEADVQALLDGRAVHPDQRCNESIVAFLARQLTDVHVLRAEKEGRK